MIKTDKYHIRFFQVGDKTKGGDAIVIELFDENDTPHIMIIDGGYKETGDSIVKYLKGKYSKDGKPVHIDFIFSTHPDLDHISGLKSILSSDDLTVGFLAFNRPWRDGGLKRTDFDDKRITKDSLINRIKEEFAMADDLESIAEEKKIRMTEVKQGRSAYNGIIKILGPSDTFYKQHLLMSDKTPDNFLNKYNHPYAPTTTEEEDYTPVYSKTIEWFDNEQTSDVNETSLIIALVLGDFNMLFTGDAGKDALNEALDYWETLGFKSDSFSVVQLPHHGSRKNINPDIIKRLKAPEYIISCPPQGESEGHPSRRLINKILEITPKADIYKTGDKNFNFHKGIKVNYSPQTPQGIKPKMDGKLK